MVVSAGQLSLKKVAELCFPPKAYPTDIPKNAGVSDKKTKPNHQTNNGRHLTSTLPL